jgi:dephospho-CoA kinase
MLRIGITGGIGSGKSLVCKYFENLRIPVFNADDIANKIIDTDAGIRKKIPKYFGPSSYNDKGLNRKFIRDRVFNDAEALTALNSITHPVILNYFDNWCKRMKKEGHRFVIKEAAIIFESESYKQLDYFVSVIAPVETRIRRVMERDGKTREEVEHIIRRQMSDEEKIKRSDLVISNPGDELLLPQIVELHEILINKTI